MEQNGEYKNVYLKKYLSVDVASNLPFYWETIILRVFTFLRFDDFSN